MANTNAPFGLNPFGQQNGATPNFNLAKALFASNNTQVCARGDGLQFLTSGYVSAITGTGVAVSQWAGIFWGCEYLSAALGRRVVSTYWPGGDNSSQEVEVLYVPFENNPAVRIVAQATSTKFTRAMVYGNFDINYVAPTAYTGRGKSNVTIASSTINTTPTLPFRLVDLWSSYAATGQPGADDSDYNWGIFEFNSAQSTGLSA